MQIATTHRQLTQPSVRQEKSAMPTQKTEVADPGDTFAWSNKDTLTVAGATLLAAIPGIGGALGGISGTLNGLVIADKLPTESLAVGVGASLLLGGSSLAMGMASLTPGPFQIPLAVANALLTGASTAAAITIRHEQASANLAAAKTAGQKLQDTSEVFQRVDISRKGTSVTLKSGLSIKQDGQGVTVGERRLQSAILSVGSNGLHLDDRDSGTSEQIMPDGRLMFAAKDLSFSARGDVPVGQTSGEASIRVRKFVSPEETHTAPFRFDGQGHLQVDGKRIPMAISPQDIARG